MNFVPSLQAAGASAHYHPYTAPYLIIKMFFHMKLNEGADLPASQPNNVFEVLAGYFIIQHNTQVKGKYKRNKGNS